MASRIETGTYDKAVSLKQEGQAGLNPFEEVGRCSWKMMKIGMMQASSVLTTLGTVFRKRSELEAAS